MAGFPGYPRNFSRDSFTYGLLAEDFEATEAQIEFSAKHQGKKKDPLTGEELGKIHHELDAGTGRGFKIGELETTYNGCDTTAHFLEAVAWLAENGKPEILRTHKRNIDAALGYIYTHIGPDNLFREDPHLAGAQEYALRVTYWKDSAINSEDQDPQYPRIFSLAHFQNSHALGRLGQVMNRPELVEQSEKMEEAGIKRLWNLGHFVTGIEGQQRVIDPMSSDSLHCLYYIEPTSEALPAGSAESIEAYSEPLETQAGYRAGMPTDSLNDYYHTNYVWTHEQAILHSAAERHKLEKAKLVAGRIIGYLSDGFPELISARDFLPAGNPTQLWAVGAGRYFEKSQLTTTSEAA